MSAIAVKPSCVACGKEVTILKCESCWKTGINQEMVGQDKVKVQQHKLIQEVDDWECNAINRIRETAVEARRQILKHTTDPMSQVAQKFSKLNDQLQQCQQANNFDSMTVSQWQAKLIQLSQQMVNPSSITVRHVSTPLVTNIIVDIPALNSVPNIAANTKWIQNGTTVVGGNGAGNALNQLNCPHGLYVDDDQQTIYVTDTVNHRVVEWKIGVASGRVVAGGNGPGNQGNQLNWPTGVIVDKETDSLLICDYINKRVVRWPRQNGTSGETIIAGIGAHGLAMDSYGYLYVCDHDKHEVKRWKIGETNGIVVAGGNGSGNRLDQLTGPMHIFVDQDRSVYVSDYFNHRVMKWIEGSKEGIVVAGGQGAGDSLTQLHHPREVFVDQLGTVYVAEQSSNRVTRWPKGAIQGSVVVGGNEAGAQPNQFNIAIGLSFDRQCNLYVADHNNHRVQRFNIDPTSIQ